MQEPADYRFWAADDEQERHRLIIQKDKGGLTYPTEFINNVIIEAERITRLCTQVSETNKLTYNRLISEVRRKFGNPPAEMAEHALETQHGIDNHYSNLLENIVRKYFQIRQHHIGRRKTMSLHKKRKRSKLNKLVLFNGE